MASLATTTTSTTTTLNDDGIVVSGLLWRHVRKAEVCKGGVLHLCVRQYGVVLYGVGVAWHVVDLEEELRALGFIKFGNLAKTYVGAAIAGPPGKQDRHPKAHKTLSPLGVDCVGRWRHGVTRAWD